MHEEAFRVVVADPPWQFQDMLPGKGRGAAKHYDVMNVRDICNLKLPPIADDAVLFLWRVAAMQQEALDVAKDWGFTIKSEIVWAKGEPSKLAFGMGRYVRASHETCLIGARGHAASMVRDHGIRSVLETQSVIYAPRGEHSVKPDELQELIERMVEGPYLELFARRERKGWSCLGEKLGKKLVIGRSGQQSLL